MRRAALVLALLSGCVGPGIMRMGMSLKVDVLGVKVHFKLPVEFYPLTDAGYPPEGLVCE